MSISRREFTSAVGASLVTSSLVGSEKAALAGCRLDDETPEMLRVIAYNIYAGSGWPKDRKRAKQAVAKRQMAQRLAMELALYAPDIINFSESPPEAFTKEVAELLGMHHVRFPSGGNWPGTLLSRFEITNPKNVPTGKERHKDLFTRHWGRANIKLPDGSSLIVHSAHLFPTADPVVRLKEIRQMLESMKPDLEAKRSMLLIGDLNHGPETEEYKLWKKAGWVDTFAKVGKGEGPTIKSDIPKWRINYVMAAGPIAYQIVESRPLFEGAFRLNIADDQSFALSDHLPQMAVFRTSK